MIAALRAGLERLPFSELADALDAAEEARSLVEEVSAGSDQAEFLQVLAWSSQVINGIDELRRKLSVIHADVIDLANRLEGSSRTDEPLTPTPVPVADPSSDVGLLNKLPERVGGRTTGIWVDEMALNTTS